ncbi:hypothetical protein Tco_0909111 [Tanacetum coccineum]|uniref:Uncharacterized protein n=1 Tax=Tanacetum coccineum TaxID=301880 RepID=A0ABQ5CP13_9ASTR
MFEFKFDIQGSGLPLDILYSSLPCLLDSGLRETAAWQRFDKMVEENVPAPTPTRSDEQILDILQNTNFFRAFTASANVPTIYIKQFWNTLIQDAKTGLYSFQLDEQWFTLNAYLLCKALEITLVDSGHPFVSPPTGDQEEFVQAIRIFFAHWANLNIPTKKPTTHVTPYCRFTKLIIFYLGSEHNIHRRPWSLVHVMGDDFLLGNLKFVPKGEKDEVFGKFIPKELITEAIQNSSYYQQYLEMAAHTPTAKEGGQKKTTSKADKPKRPTPVKQPALAEQIKLVKEKTSKPTPSKKIHKGKVMKVHKEKSGVAIREPASGITQRLPVVEGKGKGIAIDEQIPVTQHAPTGPSTQPQDDISTNVVRNTSSPTNAKTGADTEKSNSEGDTEILNVDEERGENISNTVALEERTVELDEGQAGSDSGKTPESRPPPKHFLNDKPTEEEPGKANVETEVESLVTVPIHQASSSAPPLSTPIIDLIPPKPISHLAQEPVFTATTATTTRTLLPPPPPQQ